MGVLSICSEMSALKHAAIFRAADFHASSGGCSGADEHFKDFRLIFADMLWRAASTPIL